MTNIKIFILVVILFVININITYGQDKPRLIVLTDIGGDPDDEQSLVRLLVYANEFDIEGIITQHWDQYAPLGFTPEEQMDLVRTYIYAYGQVVGNLSQHATGYPTQALLLNNLKRGGINIPNRLSIDEIMEVENVVIGPGMDTEGSEWIKQIVDSSDTRPVNITVWGGPSDLAQALWSVRNTRTESEVAEFVSKMRVHAIEDQDDTGYWIRANFPSLFYILSKSRDGISANSVFRGMYLGGDETLTSSLWVNTHVRFNHGALGSQYPDVTFTSPNPYNCLKEGDTPAFLYFLNNGLYYPTEPSYGCWGGRFEPQSTYYQDAFDEENSVVSHRATVWRWREDFQNDFQARMDWCVYPNSGANHNPMPEVEGELERTVLSNAVVNLNASNSTDPDGNALSYNWFVYQEPGSYTGEVVIQNNTSPTAYFVAPNVNNSKTLHIILSVKDDGQPSLVSYKRLIFTIIPSSTLLNISGNALYYSNNAPIKNVVVSIATTPDTTDTTNTVGYYEFVNLAAGGSYTTASSKLHDTDIGFNSITTYDAALTAQAAIEILQLSDNQKIAADVTRDGNVHFIDAAYIAQYAVGLPKNASSHAGEWDFLPQSLVYPSLVEDQVNQNYTTILIGDVDGGWTQPGSLLWKEITIMHYEKLKDISVNHGDELIIPLEMENNSRAIAAEIEFEYDANVLQFVSAQKTPLSKDMVLIFNDEAGRLRAAIYGTTPINEPGKIVNLVFYVQTKSQSTSELALNRFLLNNDVLMKATSKLFVNGKIENPQSYKLNQNYPNPFIRNGRFNAFPHQVININYQLPQKEKVILKIYNYLGQEIKTLVDSEHEPGSYKVFWNGLDNNGISVLPGLYFYRINAGEFKKTKRMIILN